MKKRLTAVLGSAGLKKEDLVLDNERMFGMVARKIRKECKNYLRKHGTTSMSLPKLKKPHAYPCIYHLDVCDTGEYRPSYLGWGREWYITGEPKIDSVDVMEYLLSVNREIAVNIAHKVLNENA